MTEGASGPGPWSGTRTGSGHRRRTRTGIVAVAARAGVSASTVSLYSNSPERVSPHLAARIQQAMDELRYRANPHARALRTATVETVFIVLDATENAGRVVGVFRDHADALERTAALDHAIVVESSVE
jgi:DNA-binding LacI/PurR family transcriptional regulator